jgi:hypothetical protein
MPLSLQHRRPACRLHPRCSHRDHRCHRGVGGHPDTSPLDIETALRTANGQAYLVANRTTVGFQIVLGTPAWQAALDDAGLTVEQNWAALAGARPKLRAHAGMAPVSLSGRRDQFKLVLR